MGQKKGFKHSEESKLKMRLSQIGNRPMSNKETARKVSIALTGRKLSDETKSKISLAGKGKHNSPATEFKKGRKYVPLSNETKEKIRMAAIKQHLEGRVKYANGYKHTELAKEKIRAARAKQVITKEHKHKISEAHLNKPNRKFKNTGIENKVEFELKIRGVKYEKHTPILGVALVDFYLPEYNTIIECDGCFWHGCQLHYPYHHQDTLLRDTERTKKFILGGFKVYRFWEHEINESASNCINRVFV